MRFEALKQLFKTFAKTGAFRITCGRCADFWTMKMAIQRTWGIRATWGASEIVRGSAPHTYRRNTPISLRENGAGRTGGGGVIQKVCLEETDN